METTLPHVLRDETKMGAIRCGSESDLRTGHGGQDHGPSWLEARVQRTSTRPSRTSERGDVVRARDQGSIRCVLPGLGQLSQVLASRRAVGPRHPHRYHIGQVDDHAILVRLAVVPSMA
jgi:hypothetical protein